MGILLSSQYITETHTEILNNPICNMDKFHQIISMTPSNSYKEIYAWKIACVYRFIMLHEYHNPEFNYHKLFDEYNKLVSTTYENLLIPTLAVQATLTLYYIYLGSGNSEYLSDVNMNLINNFIV